MRKGTGLVDRVGNKLTKSKVGVYDSQAPGCPFLEHRGRRWIVHCEGHDKTSGFETSGLAKLQASFPETWCPDCREIGGEEPDLTEKELVALRQWKSGEITTQEFREALGVSKK